MDKINYIKMRLTDKICALLSKTVLRDKDISYVAMFHKITPDEVGAREPFACSQRQFESYLTGLKRAGMNVISVDDLLTHPVDEVLKKKVVLTFDDGFADIDSFVAPLLTRHGVPFTVFITTSLLNTEGYLTTEQLKVLAQNPLCTIGMHAHRHLQFRSSSKEELLADFCRCKEELCRLTGKEPLYYAFPYGSVYACSWQNSRVVRGAGVKAVFMTLPLKLTAGLLRYRYYLPRIDVPTLLKQGKMRYD